jgi:hypothetical protein
MAVLLGAGTASAGKLVPLHTKSNLRGTLRFFPLNGGHTFKCQVDFVLLTGKGGGNNTQGKQPEIESATGLNCSQLFAFEGLPWRAGPDGGGATTVSVFPFGWAVQGGPSCNEDQEFSVNKKGIWTATSGCVTGSLTSTPPVTIKQ